jgi:hypothetical protein
MAVAEDDNVWIMRRIERKTAMPLARAIASRSKHALPILGILRCGASNCQLVKLQTVRFIFFKKNLGILHICVGTWGRAFRCGASDFGFGFKNAARATIPWLRPLPHSSVFFATQDNGRRRPGEHFGFSFRLGCQWGYHRVWIVS